MSEKPPRRPDEQLDLLKGDPIDPRSAPSPSGVPLLAEAPPAPNLYVGTCSYVHDHWRAVFYPKGLRKDEELAYYARYFNAVEIDASFYGVPTMSTVARWAATVPPTFRFALKAPRSLTHDSRLSLDDATARQDWNALLGVAELLGEQLGAVLLQLGPNVDERRRNHLARVLDSRPVGMPLAVEFRHPSWHTPETNDLLRTHGVVRSWTDAYLDPRRETEEDDPAIFEQTGGFLFVRLLGDVSTKYQADGSLAHRYGRPMFDRTADMARWVARMRGAKERVSAIHLYINNHYEGYSPGTAVRLRAMLGEG